MRHLLLQAPKPAALVLLLAPALLLVQSCGKSNASTGTEHTDAVPVTVMDLHPTERAADVHVAGLFSTDDETYLAFKTGGVLRQVLVKEGDAVKAGQLLATLDLTEIDAQVRQAELGREKAGRDRQRVEALHADSVVSLEQLQNARTGEALAEQQLNAAQFNLRYSEIRAPQDGFVLQKLANPGQLVGPGTPVLQVNGATSATWVLKAGVSDKDWALTHVGDSAVISVDAWPDRVIDAVVSNRSMGADPRSGAFLIELRVSGTHPEGLASGLYGKATIHTHALQEGFAIPYEAVLDGDGDHGSIYTVGADGKAHKRPIVIKAFNNDGILITGPDPGARLIVSGGAYLTDGASITIAH